ncbi:MAG: FHA domain-containing protein [Gemmatimonadaceae bacterium]
MRHGYARHSAPTETGPTTAYMPFINLRDTPIRLPAGQLRIGRGRGVEISLPVALGGAHNGNDGVNGEGGGAGGGGGGVARQGQFALLVIDPSGSATLSKLSEEAPVYLNSVPAGLEPTPLLHGDRVEIDGIELRYSDDRQAGSTAEFPVIASDQSELVLAGRPPGPAIRDAAGQSARVGAPVKNGRLVSLVDGREYAVHDDGLSIGRDAACDVVVPTNSVSRRHARIALEVRGYTITDSSTNGVIVSGERVRSTRLLRRGDVIRVGPEEFRFYEEEVAFDPTPPAPSPPLHIATPAPLAPPMEERPKAAVLATLVNASQGVERGRVFEITSLLTHIGRGAHNDIVLDDDSVSDSHAKLQRRDGRWILIDLDSTNGTYAGGERLTGDVELRGDTDVRFGGAKLVFKPARLTHTPSGGTRVVAAYGKKRTPTPNEPAPVVGAEAASVTEDDGPDESQRSLAILWVALIGVIALTVSVILRALW